jgi:hypothetical protein
MPPKICLEEGLFLMGGEWWSLTAMSIFWIIVLSRLDDGGVAFRLQLISGSNHRKKRGHRRKEEKTISFLYLTGFFIRLSRSRNAGERG